MGAQQLLDWLFREYWQKQVRFFISLARDTFFNHPYI